MKPTADQISSMIITTHLQYSNSLDDAPSSNADIVSTVYLNRCREDDFTIEEWDALTMDEKNEYAAKRFDEFYEAVPLADMKWQAARTLLGV